nr:PEP/pyruvate-binding domain-containing protein [Planosporangium thailandense]
MGGKCASLVTMTAAGMPVPPGFAVTTAHYDEVVHRSGMAAAIQAELAGLDYHDVAAVDAASARIREQIASREIPADLRAQVLAAYDALQSRFADEVPVAVRSSATAEDLPDASFAGQQDTYLWVRGRDAVLEHIRRCWASLYTCRAILYRLKNGIPDEGLSMAVAVQKMVNSRVAGVAMTIDPTSGDRSKITIDASYGVGEMVVSGQVTPDNIVLDKVMLCVVAETIGDKHAELVPDVAAGRLVERAVDAERRRRRCLTAEEVTAIARMAKRAEKHYCCPQDVEWALDADLPPGQDLLLLQARPETVHSAGSGRKEAPAPAPAVPGFNLSGITSMLTAGLGKV